MHDASNSRERGKWLVSPAIRCFRVPMRIADGLMSVVRHQCRAPMKSPIGAGHASRHARQVARCLWRGSLTPP